MTKLPETLIKAWENREDAIIFTTVNEAGMPNAIYATCVSKFDDNIFLVADNYFDKTRKNILSNSPGSILFITKDGNSYQMKGSISYHKEGEIFEDMKQWNPSKHPGHAVAALNVTEVYSGAKKLV